MANDAARDLGTIDLRELQAGGRISNLKLAEALHLSPTAVLERVKRLARGGDILGDGARLSPLKRGAGIGSVVWILPGVRGTRTCVVMEEVKNSSRRPV